MGIFPQDINSLTVSPSPISGHSHHLRAHSTWCSRPTEPSGFIVLHTVYDSCPPCLSPPLCTHFLEVSNWSDSSWCPQGLSQETAQSRAQGLVFLRSPVLPSPGSTWTPAWRHQGQPFCGFIALLLSMNMDSRAAHLASLTALVCFHSFAHPVASAWNASYPGRINSSLF